MLQSKVKSTTAKKPIWQGVKESVLETLCLEFAQILGIQRIDWSNDNDFSQRCGQFADYLSRYSLRPKHKRKRAFLAHVNWKFRINANHLGALYEKGAKHGQTFNYHQKSAIQLVFDRDELDRLPALLETFGVNPPIIDELTKNAVCASEAETRKHLHAELETPSKLRCEVGDRDVDIEILKALFASFLWVLLPERDMHRFFDIDFNEDRYQESFWNEIQARSPRLFHRDEAVHLLVVSSDWSSQFKDLKSLRDALLCRVAQSYQSLNNYGFLAVLIQPVHFDGRDVSWELSADVCLFGEKHIETPLDRAYFRHEKIKNETLDHISQLNINEARFDLANEGFTYRDCFVLNCRDSQRIEQLLILQKNHRDETIVPCPTCRSSDVEGNSYPSLGVKSWECRNPLCPDRSKYNRGKRYSFRGLAMQQALDDERNDISPEFVKRWRRDVVDIFSYADVLEMLVRHYSMWGDQIRCFGSLGNEPTEILGRSLQWKAMPAKGDGDRVRWFKNAAFFKRYGVQPSIVACNEGTRLGDYKLSVFCGDSKLVLRTIESDSVDGAVTSPPYYNAREYSQWPNMYCYLQDMYEINAQVYRTLKPGSLYFYNIFDYFDNENIVALSAMGQKRVILSAYTVDLFRRIGFELIGNVVWDKGEIEGKRGFNAGNFSPFYQTPFNCWEHVLVFRKPGNTLRPFDGSRVLRAKPVIKMVRGINTHGHSAPYPEEIPMLCLQNLPPNAVVLDPFGGSLTTGRMAVQVGRRAICIEQSREYCDLGLSLYAAQNSPQRELVL